MNRLGGVGTAKVHTAILTVDEVAHAAGGAVHGVPVTAVFLGEVGRGHFAAVRDESDISDVEALRRLTREALDDADETLHTVNRTALLAGFVYVYLYVTSDPATAGAVGGLYIAFAALWSSYPATFERFLP